jgi:hypothetical protein
MMAAYHFQSPQVAETGSYQLSLILEKVVAFGETILSGVGVTGVLNVAVFIKRMFRGT